MADEFKIYYKVIEHETAEELEVALQARAFVEGNASDTTNLGWISPLDALLTDLVNSLGGFKHVSQ